MLNAPQGSSLLLMGLRCDRTLLARLVDGILFALQMVIAAMLISQLTTMQISLSVVTTTFLALMTIVLLRGLLLWLTTKQLYQTTYDDGLALRHTLLARLAGMSLGHFYALQPGQVIQALSEDVLWLENHASSTRPDLVFNSAVLLTLLVAACLFWPVAGFSAVGMILCSFLFLSRIKQRVARGLDRRAKSLEHSALAITEYAEGLPVLRSFGIAQSTSPVIETEIDKLRTGARKAVVATTPLLTLFRAIVDCAIAVAILVALVFLLQQATITVNDISKLLAACLLIATSAIPARNFASYLAMLALAKMAKDTVSGILTQPVMQHGDTSPSLTATDIVFDNVSFTYPGQSAKALDQVNLIAKQHCVTALVGHNGSGKSTCLQLLMRFQETQAGRIRIGGIDISDMPPAALASLISPVFQEAQLFHDTIMNNIRIGRPGATDEEVFAAARAAAIHTEILARPEGYQSLVAPMGRDLSGGQRQRIAIARAILKDAPIILLDEATSALDPENESLIQHALQSLIANKTVLIVAHRLSSILSADQIIVMDNGQCKAAGTHAQLLASSPHYQQLWQRFDTVRNWQISQTSVTPDANLPASVPV